MTILKTLILVDLQNDFCAGGALAVKDGDALIPIANALMPLFQHVVASQDWHPANHASFAQNQPGHHIGDVIWLHGIRQVLWPVHCVQHSRGAAFHPDLQVGRIQEVVQKGTDPEVDSYSAFFDNDGVSATKLHAWLQQKGANELTVMGLATDYCVKYTVLDALKLGYSTTLIADACRAVNLQDGDGERAIDEMRAAGAVIAYLRDFSALP